MRVKTLDIMRGTSILLMILAHTFHYWLNSSNTWVEGVLFLILNVMGNNGFVFVSGMGFAFSWSRNEEKNMSRKQNLQKSLSATFSLFALALVFNGVLTIAEGTGLAGLWKWDLFLCLATSRLMSTFLIKFSKRIRFMVGVVVLLATPLLLWWVYPGTPIYFNWLTPRPTQTSFTSALNYLLFNPAPNQDNLLVFFPFFIWGTIIGQSMQEITRIHNKLPVEGSINKKVISRIKKWLLLGVILIVVGVISGLRGTPYDYGYYTLQMMNNSPYINLTTLPIFLVTSTFPWVLYCAGIEIIIAALLLYYKDLKNQPQGVGFLVLYGNFSLTIYLSHHAILLIPFQFNWINGWIPEAITMFLIWYAVYLLDKKWRGKVSVEYVLGITGTIFYNWMKKREVVKPLEEAPMLEVETLEELQAKSTDKQLFPESSKKE